MTPYTSSEGMRGRASSVRPSYADMATWELELIRENRFKYGTLGRGRDDGLYAELSKRHTEDRLNRNWDQLQREGFGL